MMDFSDDDLAEVRYDIEDGVYTLVFQRLIHHPAEKLWSALTDPAELAEWAPFDANRNLGAAGPVTLTMAGGDPAEPMVLECDVKIAEENRRLQYSWGGDMLTWELEPQGKSTMLTLLHRVEDPAWINMVAAGWHICLNIAERFLGGAPAGRIVGEEAKKHGWESLRARYAEKLGLE